MPLLSLTARKTQGIVILLLYCFVSAQLCYSQLPDDIQRELNHNLEAQARKQQLLAQQRQKQANNNRGAPSQRSSGGSTVPSADPGQQKAPQDPNNFSYQQVSPPMQYSYYRPFGDDAQQQQQQQQPQQQPQQSNNNQQQYQPVPSFTGAGGLPQVPADGNNYGGESSGQQGGAKPKPLTENDFKDITEGQNYGAPSGSDFGLGDVMSGNAPSVGGNRGSSNSGDFGMGTPAGFGGAPGGGGGNPMGPGGAPTGLAQLFGGAQNRQGPSQGFGGMMNNQGGGSQQQQQQMPVNIPGLDGFGDAGGFGNDFTGANMNNQPAQQIDSAATGSNNLFGQQPQQRSAQPNMVDDGAIDISDMGDTADQLGGGQPLVGGRNNDDFNYAAAAENQPISVPYPDSAPQPVGSLWALTQPASLTQTRYNPLPDKGTYQDYPSYLMGSLDGRTVSDVVDETPRARRPGPGRYGAP